jgi:hypothetical protein
MSRAIAIAYVIGLLCAAPAIAQQPPGQFPAASPDLDANTAALKRAMQQLYNDSPELSELPHLPHGSAYYLDYYRSFVFFGVDGGSNEMGAAANVVFWTNDLVKIGYPIADIMLLMADYEKAATTIRLVPTGPGEATFEGDPNAEPRLAEGLEKLRKNTARPKVIAGQTPAFAPPPPLHQVAPEAPVRRGTGKGKGRRSHKPQSVAVPVDALFTGIPVFISTDPKGAEVQLIPSGFFYVCEANHIDPYSAQCNYWVSVQDAGNILAGRYLYKARWRDGLISCGSLTFLTDLERHKAITLRKPELAAKQSCLAGNI